MKQTAVVLILIAFTLFALPPDLPIAPKEYQQMLGHGFDVAWCEFRVKIEGYGSDEIAAMKERGFSTARLRTSLPAGDSLFTIMDERVRDCLDSGIVPIIAYHGGAMEDDPSEENIQAAVDWWDAVAVHYADYPHPLAFNLVVEWTGVMSKDAALINRFYELVTPIIRASNPTRIIIYSPKRISNPEYLSEMVVPESAGKYVLAEWHFYAAGPSEDPASSKYWTIGTEQQKKLLTDKVDYALAWSGSTGIPTWVGAWMAGNYNKGNTTPMETQIDFASFMVQVLDSVEIPWCINTIDKFYDYGENRWIDSMSALLDVIALDPSPVALVDAVGKTAVKFIFSGESIHFETARKREAALFSLNGRRLFRGTFSGKSVHLPLNSLARGSYLIRITADGEHLSLRCCR